MGNSLQDINGELERFEDSNLIQENKTIKRWAIAIISTVVFLWMLFAFIGFIYMNTATATTFSDLFVSLNALYSGFALTGIVVTILLQRIDLKEQKKLLNLQLMEIQKSSEIQKGSEEALKTRVELEISLAKRQTTLSLYDEWHRQDTRESRIFISHWIKERHRQKDQFLTLSEIEDTKGDIELHVFRLIHFFEKWAYFSKHNEINNEFISELLSSYVLWYEANFIDPLLKPNETNPDFIELLRLIKRYVFVDSIHRH